MIGMSSVSCMKAIFYCVVIVTVFFYGEFNKHAKIYFNFALICFGIVWKMKFLFIYIFIIYL